MRTIPELVSQLTLEEKAAICAGRNMWQLNGVERLGIPSITLTNGPHGVQKQAGAGDFVGIGASLPATCFPPAVIQAATWNRDLVREMGAALAAECRQAGVSVLLGPGINIKRSPLGGRNYDYYSEDPYLTGQLAAAYVEGVQGGGVGVSLKHYAVGNQEYRRMTIDALVDERALREIYLAAFEHVVRAAAPWTVMNSYTLVNGQYCSEHETLIRDILRDEWGYDGVALTDWGSANDRVAGLAAGIDLEMPGPATDNQAAIVAAARAGRLDAASLDRAVTRILRLIERSRETPSPDAPYDTDAHHDLARRVAEEGIVLLKNDGPVLPIPPGARVGLLGRFARQPLYQGAGSSLTTATRVDNLHDELIKRIGADRVRYAPGFPEQAAAAVDEALLAEALAVAAQVDVVVVMPGVGVAEGGDQPSMKLPASQTALLERVLVAHPRVVVLLSNGNPLEMPWADAAPAILESYLAGQAGAAAQADILLGRVNPSGKLAESFPLRLEDNPSHPCFPGGPTTVEYRESIYVGYRHYDTAGLPVRFPFGHGLSYTTFAYRDLRVEPRADGATVRLTVKNTGAVAGKETAQVYVRDVKSTAFRPAKELKGFVKVALAPGEEQTVTVALDRRAFAFYDTGSRAWVVEAGEFEILAGASAQDCRLAARVRIESPQAAAPVARRELLAPYYAPQPGAGFSREAFAALYGRPLPPNEPPRKGRYTLNTPIGDMADSFIARQLYALMRRQVRQMFPQQAGEENPMLGMVETMLKEMPLRSLAMMSNGALKRGTLEGLLLMINGRVARGVAAMLGAARSRGL